VDALVTYLYLYSQIIVFFLYIPYIKSVIRSETADAINVPAQVAFFLIGAIAATYMFIVNEDLMASLIICVHIFTGNLTVAIIAFQKQRHHKKNK